MQTERPGVHKTGFDQPFKCLAFGWRNQKIALPSLGIPDVGVGRRYVEVACKYQRRLRLQLLAHPGRQCAHPVELVEVAVAAEFGAVGHIDARKT